MKTRILKPVLSFSAVAFAVLAAFAFSTAPQKTSLVDVTGLDPNNDCEPTSTQCTTISGTPVCTNGINGPQLFDMNLSQTDCNVELYRK
ncbi:DUF6520 family protein [Flavobacterium granuli]|uniref:NVEALA protein n=1 Tax=Flavobacterium granuli TaxID=280093 RepID=A0A1M5RS17_9FLAO|nr:DUF6520 family protein [Flavobacterium granuli]PRZ22767.1 hypothetical protein BC624_10615 [Flavobacterium granuli]SHH29122.1 hypothetical protein SAMN05443373_110107 [Flavobacterium granuli]